MGYILGIGAANMDLCAKPNKQFILHDSNPGTLSCSCGGVTRNICENLSRLGASVSFISAVGEDVFSQMIKDSCQQVGMDISHLYVARQRTSSSYFHLLDDQGDMYIALSDMHVLKEMPLSHLDKNEKTMKDAELVVCDPSLSEDAIVRILDICQGHTPVYVDPVSTTYAQLLKTHIGRFHTIKPNKMELEVLCDRPIENEADIRDACMQLLKKGTKRIIVSLGEEGCYYADSQHAFCRKLLPIKQMVNATGGGDAFFAAIIYAALHKYEPREMVNLALAAGIAAITSETTINPNISLSLLNQIIEERNHG